MCQRVLIVVMTMLVGYGLTGCGESADKVGMPVDVPAAKIEDLAVSPQEEVTIEGQIGILPGIEVLPDVHPEEREVDLESVLLPNCDGTAEVEYIFSKDRTVERVMTFESGLEVQANGQVGLFGTDIEVGAAVASILGREYGVAERVSRSMVVKAGAGTTMEYSIRLMEVWKVGTVRVAYGRESTFEVFRFRDDFKLELLPGKRIPCVPGLVDEVAGADTGASVPTLPIVPTPVVVTATAVVAEADPTLVPPTATLVPPTATLVPPTATLIPPTATLVPRPTVEIVTSVFSLQSNKENGLQIPISQTGYYRLNYLGDAYSPWPNDSYEGYQGWTTIVRVYVNRPVTWGMTEYGLPGPIDHDDYLGATRYYLNRDEALTASVGSQRQFYMKAGEYLTVVTLDEQGAYTDNRGKVDLGLTFLGN